MQQALERQIVFEDHKEAYALLGDRDEFLQVLRENFACQFISRGEQLEILGEAAEDEESESVEAASAAAAVADELSAKDDAKDAE